MRLTDILSRLDGVQDDHDGHLAFCPVHRDRRTPSLKLTLKDDGTLLVVCRAGCEKPKILEALGLPASALFDVQTSGERTVSAAVPESVGIAETAALRMFVDATSGALMESRRATDYLMDRFGLSPEAAEDLGVGYAAEGERPQPWLSRGFTRYPRLTVPLYGFDGVARGLQGRDLSGRCPARWMSLTNVPGKVWSKYGILHAGTGYDTILITEGPGDGLTSVGVGYDALIIRGAAMANNAALLAELVVGLRGRDVVIAFDPDTAGERGTRALVAALTADGQTVRRLAFPVPEEDLTAWRERTPTTFPRSCTLLFARLLSSSWRQRNLRSHPARPRPTPSLRWSRPPARCSTRPTSALRSASGTSWHATAGEYGTQPGSGSSSGTERSGFPGKRRSAAPFTLWARS